MNTLPEHDALEQVTPPQQSQQIVPQETTVCVVGLGYVGLPLAVGFDDAGYDVIGYDVNEETVRRLSQGTDPTGDLGNGTIQDGAVEFTSNADTVSDASHVLVTVPTPIDENDQPQMDYVESAARTVGRHMMRGTTVVLESTVYPGATRDVLVPALEDTSGLDCGEDFYVGYSPERANPGDEEHGLENVVKIVSGQNDSVLRNVAALYERVIDAGVHRAPSIEVAEAAKVIENVQRDVNIALVNDLARTFEDIGIDTQAVLSAAETKWNFHDYRPGLVSGHCIPVDPYFLLHRAEREEATSELVRTSREINESMPNHVADLVVKALTETGRPLADSEVLAAGLTYKADVADVRNAKVQGVLSALREYQIDLVGYDPLVPNAVIDQQYDIPTQETLSFEGFDGLLLATPHEEFERLDPQDVTEQLADRPAIVDVYGTLEPSQLADDVAYRRL